MPSKTLTPSKTTNDSPFCFQEHTIIYHLISSIILIGCPILVKSSTKLFIVFHTVIESFFTSINSLQIRMSFSECILKYYSYRYILYALFKQQIHMHAKVFKYNIFTCGHFGIIFQKLVFIVLNIFKYSHWRKIVFSLLY